MTDVDQERDHHLTIMPSVLQKKKKRKEISSISVFAWLKHVGSWICSSAVAGLNSPRLLSGHCLELSVACSQSLLSHDISSQQQKQTVVT